MNLCLRFPQGELVGRVARECWNWALHFSQLLSPSQPRVTQLLGRGGHIPRDQLPVVIRTLDSPGVALSGHGDQGEKRLVVCSLGVSGQAGGPPAALSWAG